MIPALGMQGQIDLEYEVSLGHTATEALPQKTNKTKTNKPPKG